MLNFLVKKFNFLIEWYLFHLIFLLLISTYLFSKYVNNYDVILGYHDEQDRHGLLSTGT